jgi:cytochrome subunit of sulfide dehydrogenase
LKILPISIVAAVFAFSAVAHEGAHAQQDQRGRDLALTCSGCHGTNGRSASGMPSIAGLEQVYIAKQMNDFKSGARTATVMHQIAKGYNDEQIALLAAYFSAQKN